MADVPPIPRENWIPALNRVGWEPVLDRILHGLCHAFSGGVSSLVGLTFLLESDSDNPGQAVQLLGQELEQLEGSVNLLRLLPDDSVGVELLAPTTLMPEMIALVRSQRGLEDIEFDLEFSPDAPAIQIDPTFFFRSLLLLFTGAAEAALAAGEGRVRVAAGQEDGGLLIELRPGFPTGEERAVDPGILPKRILPKDRIQGVVAVLEEEGIRAKGLTPEEGSGWLKLYFPSASSS